LSTCVAGRGLHADLFRCNWINWLLQACLTCVAGRAWQNWMEWVLQGSAAANGVASSLQLAQLARLATMQSQAQVGRSAQEVRQVQAVLEAIRQANNQGLAGTLSLPPQMEAIIQNAGLMSYAGGLNDRQVWLLPPGFCCWLHILDVRLPCPGVCFASCTFVCLLVVCFASCTFVCLLVVFSLHLAISSALLLRFRCILLIRVPRMSAVTSECALKGGSRPFALHNH
jgi:hypothetical protein